MKIKTSILWIAMTALLSGCEFSNPLESITSEMRNSKLQVNALEKQINKLEILVATQSLTERNQLSKDVATSGRLASIVVNYMLDKKIIELSEDDVSFLLKVSLSLKDDIYRDVFYQSLDAQNYPYTTKRFLNNNDDGYLHQGIWYLKAPSGSLFATEFPKVSLKAFDNESIPKPDCGNGNTPKAMTGLLINQAEGGVSSATFKIINSPSSWTVKFDKPYTDNSNQAYRVLFKVVCVTNSTTE
jgi:hypothetical protein